MKKHYRSEFKRKVALEAIEGKASIGSLSGKYGVHPEVIEQWKQEAYKAMKEVFETKKTQETLRQEKLINQLYKEIGIMKMEKEFLKKKLKQLGIK
jgi:transposase-like protein